MSEPTAAATEIMEIARGILHWSIQDERIKFRSDAYAVREGSELVLIDPLPIREGLLEEHGKVVSIVITGSCHQRSAWRFRKKYGVMVHAPEDAGERDEEPDGFFMAEDRLPGGLQALHAPGTIGANFPLLLERGHGYLFCADLLVRDETGVRALPEKYVADREAMIHSVNRLRTVPFDGLCPAHGEPLPEGGRQAVIGARMDLEP